MGFYFNFAFLFTKKKTKKGKEKKKNKKSRDIYLATKLISHEKVQHHDLQGQTRQN